MQTNTEQMNASETCVPNTGCIASFSVKDRPRNKRDFLDRNIPIAGRSRGAVPLLELWDLYCDLAQRLEDLPAGTPIQFIIEKDL